ncbi:MAG: glycosyltransferase family 4 protein [Cytophagaceae bacterium]|jgi:glycosyltransferase involved in cell wall biosynthesis|nr:glycosyltransferase family 4 protein [Cytophagaceae bacterium]
MILAFDAKRAFHNNRGLGNYSRDIIRLMTGRFADNRYFLFSPIKPSGEKLFDVPHNAEAIVPQNTFYRMFPGVWRSSGCLSLINGLKPDIYHGLSQELPYGIHNTKVGTVVTMHDAIFMRFPELYPAVYRKIFEQKNKYSVKAADRIIAISQQTGNDFVEFFGADPAKIDVVYQGCSNIFRQKPTEEEMKNIREKYNFPHDFMLDVGAIEKRKNLETVIRAMHIAKLNIPLVVIGNKSDYLIEVKQLIADLKLNDQVIFLHGVPTKDLPTIYTLSSVFVYPSRYEGFGIPILEALCTGTPVLTSNGSCFRETGGDAALYVDYDNAEEMAHALGKIFGNTELRQSMVQKGFAHADLFTDEKVAENLMAVYRSII